jgi:hypothetical protein
LEFGDGNILTCEADLVNEQSSLHYNRITGHLVFGGVQVSGNKINILNLKFLPVPENFDFVFLLCGFLDFVVGANKQEVVDGGGEESEENHEYAEECDTFKDENEGDYVLEDEEWLGHHIEEVCEVGRYFHAVLVFTEQ